MKNVKCKMQKGKSVLKKGYPFYILYSTFSILHLLLLFPLTAFSQNLLLNGGFEEENTCTEYKIECAPEAWISSAWITGGTGLDHYIRDGRAYEGENCMGIVAGHSTRPYSRTFLRSPLLCSLKKGNQYRLEFFIKSPHAILDSVGVYFGPVEPLLERKPIHLLAPSLYLASNNHFTRDTNWQKAVLDYTAKGDEAFITISNFSRNDINGSTGMSRRYEFFIYLDDISLTPLDPREKLCSNWEEVKKDVYDQNERHQYFQRIITLRSKPDYPNKIIPGPTITIKADTLLLPDVFFATAKKELQTAIFAVLDSFCRAMINRNIDSLVIEGHADSTGTSAFNDQLSSGRAASVMAYLKACGAASKIPVISRGWGSRRPVTQNDTPANRQKNRRVEVMVYFQQEE